MDPTKAVIEVENYLYATSQLAQTTLRSVCGQSELDDLLAEREKINVELQEILDRHTDPWGVKVSAVEVKHIDLPSEMQRAAVPPPPAVMSPAANTPGLLVAMVSGSTTSLAVSFRRSFVRFSMSSAGLCPIATITV